MPDEQFSMDYKGYHFQILSVENKMIQSVLVTRLPKEEPEEQDAAVLDETEKNDKIKNRYQKSV